MPEFDLNTPLASDDGEDEQSLLAIDEGIRDAETGCAVNIEEVRKLVSQWITESSLRKGR